MLPAACIPLGPGRCKACSAHFYHVLAITCRDCFSTTGYAGVLVYCGNFNLNAGRYIEAISCYERALRADPNNTMALLGKGYALEKLKKYDGAISCFDRVLKEYPSNAFATLLKKDSLYEKALVGKTSKP